jgi:hypothetical protein
MRDQSRTGGVVAERKPRIRSAHALLLLVVLSSSLEGSDADLVAEPSSSSEGLRSEVLLADTYEVSASK